jgi:hypothetical protein
MCPWKQNQQMKEKEIMAIFIREVTSSVSSFSEGEIGFLHLITHHGFVLWGNQSGGMGIKTEKEETHINKIFNNFSEFDLQGIALFLQ